MTMLKRIAKANAVAKLQRKKIVAAGLRRSSVDSSTQEGDMSQMNSHGLNTESEEHIYQSSEGFERQPETQVDTDMSDLDGDGDHDGAGWDDAATEAQPRKARGPTVLADVWNLLPGQELPEQFNCFNQCVDNGELSKFCGTVAKNPDLTPLQYSDWRLVPNEKKEEIWRVVKSKFKLSAQRRSWVLREVSNCLRNFKHRLFCDNYYKHRTLAELKAHVDPRTTKDQWIALATYWYSPKWQAKSEKAKISRSQMKLPHTSGTIFLARRAEMEFKKTGKRPSRTKMFVQYHKHKDGKAVSPQAEALLAQIEARLQAGEDGSGDQAGDNGFAAIDGDILSQILGPESYGRVRGMGFGVTPKMFTQSNIAVIRENEEVKERNQSTRRTSSNFD